VKVRFRLFATAAAGRDVTVDLPPGRSCFVT